MSSSLRDLRLGLRTLTKSPALTIVCTIALMFGIGLTTMMFSIVYGAMLRGLPFADGDRIVSVNRVNPARDIRQQSLPIEDFDFIRRQQRSFTAFGAYTSGTMNVGGDAGSGEKAERFSGSWVTANLFGMTGTRPMLGRDFRAGEDTPGGAKVVVLGYATWRNRYAGKPSVIGRTIRINGVPYEVIGVMPEGFLFPNNDALWIPMQFNPVVLDRGQGQFVQVIALLRPGVTPDGANAELTTLSRRLATEFPKSNEGFTATADGFVDSYIGPEPEGLLYTMLGAVFLVLLIACTNVANLLLDRAAHRSKEVGVRSALGASRGDIMRVFLSEALVLAILGTVLGIVLAYVGIGIFNRALVDTQPPFFIQIALYPPVLAFAIGIAVLATLFSGLIPALQASRSDIAEVLKDESRGSSSLRIGRISRGLVIFELALSCGLLVAAGLMIRSVMNAGTRDTGFATSSVFTARVGFPSSYTDTLRQRQFFEQLSQRVAVLPGVVAASASSALPGAQSGFGGTTFAIEGVTYPKDTDYPNASAAAVSPEFFSTLSIPLRSGRLFQSSDRSDAVPVAIVNERFVRQFMPKADPIGRRVRYGNGDSKDPWATVVGVIPDLFTGDQEDPRPPVILRPFAQRPTAFAYIAARTDGDPMSLTEPVRAAVASLDPDLPIYWTMTLEKAMADQLWFVRVFGTMFMIFGMVALFLAAVGLYAVMSFSVSRRTREVGIRMALGATPRHVVRMILSQGILQVGIGLAIGLLLATGISQGLKAILFDVKPLDPLVFGGVTVVLAITGLLACFLPAQRATRVDPSDAMRAD
jgi:predicted permease